jgi:endonuclease YncB( thermonuclease family)
MASTPLLPFVRHREERVLDIDATELGQPFAPHLPACAPRHRLRARPGSRRYDRTLGRVTCGTHDANTEQVRRGMEWVFVRYARKVRRMLHGPTSAFQSRR